MKKDVFFKELIDYLELENVELSENVDLTLLEDYDSLARMAIIAFVDEKFKVKINGEHLRKVSTVKSLMDLIGPEHFE